MKQEIINTSIITAVSFLPVALAYIFDRRGWKQGAIIWITAVGAMWITGLLIMLFMDIW